ncbi:MAG: dihydropteroate synthase [Myxococcota bacterium]
MIWARPLSSTDSAALWIRSSLTPEGVGLLRSGLEQHALVTGLDAAAREVLAELVGAGWVGGAGDAAVIRYSALALENWLPRLGVTPLGTALRRLAEVHRPLAASTLGEKRFAWGERTFVMGIVNVTPDSFSDGGRDVQASIDHALTLVDEGADLLDVGGESTRPGAAAVSEAEELRRVIPVLEALRARVPSVPLSVDTRKPGVARRAVAAGAVLINDVSGLREEAMLEVLAETGAHAGVMHMQGTPETMQHDPRYDDVGAEVLDALEAALARAEARGVPRSRLWVDPGIGFGKTVAHNLLLLQRAGDLRLLGAPVLIGVSRKRFLGELTGVRAPADRLVASAATAAMLASAGAVDVLRVHDVRATKDALAVADALRHARDGGARFSS